MKKNKKKLAFYLYFLYLCHRVVTVAGPKTFSCSGRRKILPRPLQVFATTAARYCHARRKKKRAGSFSLFSLLFFPFHYAPFPFSLHSIPSAYSIRPFFGFRKVPSGQVYPTISPGLLPN
jgi:hypothetical protein